MPKLRTKTIFQKRFRVTGSGKIRHLSAGGAKLRGKKNAATLRRYATKKQIDQGVEQTVKRALGI